MPGAGVKIDEVVIATQDSRGGRPTKNHVWDTKFYTIIESYGTSYGNTDKGATNSSRTKGKWGEGKKEVIGKLLSYFLGH